MKALRDLYINGRFVVQPQSGVQRFATEVTRELLEIAGDGQCLLVPRRGAARWPGAREIGRWQGQAWEQWDLPRVPGVLVNLGNTAPLLRRRQLVVIHDAGVFSTPEAYSKPFRLWYKTMQRWLVLRGVPVVTVSEFSRQEILRHLRAAPEQVVVVPEGADHMVRITADAGILGRQQLQPGRFVLAVGNLSAHKNLQALGPLAEALAARDMVLALAGNVVNKAFNSAGERLLPKSVRFLGRVSDGELKALYENAACFVFPSRYEGFGLPAVEAMACGCPVAAAAIGALRETCADAAVFFDPAVPEDIAARVLAVCDDAAWRERLRLAGAALTRRMTWRITAEKLTEIVASLNAGAAPA